MSNLFKILKKNLPSVLFVFLLLIIYLLVRVFFKPVPEPAASVATLSNLQMAAVNIMVEMNKLIISFSLLIIGGLGGFLINRYKDIKLHSIFQIIIINFSLIFASLSIYFGYVLYFEMIQMLSNNMFDINNNMIVQPQQFQYYSFILSVILFALFVIINATQTAKKRVK